MPTDPAHLRLAQQVLDTLGIRPDALQTRAPAPTAAQYMPVVRAAATPSTLRSYGTYWTRAAEFFGNSRLDESRPSGILALQRLVTAAAHRRSSGRDGRYAGENVVRAMRTVYRLAVADGLISRRENAAAAVPLPRRLRSTRRALSNPELADIHQAALRSGSDVVLDCLLLRLHTETACRRGGALNLRLRDLDTTYCRILLREKFGTERWQPVTPTLAAELRRRALQRGARHPDDALLRYSDHSPLTPRRYDLLWERVRHALPWAAELGVSTHWTSLAGACRHRA